MPRLMAHDRWGWPLFLVIVRDPRNQYEIARDVGRCPSWLSSVMHGITDPKPADRARIAGALGVPESDWVWCKGGFQAPRSRGAGQRPNPPFSYLTPRQKL